MTTTPEAPKPSPASTPIKAPDDTLLKNFRATLEDGWNKFDSAVPAAGKSGMFASDDYAKVKAEYESAKQMLSLIKTDDQLRADIPMRQKLDETIKMLRKHNAESNKAEGYNKALVEMENNLAKLQIDVEKNNTTLPTVVPVATAVTAVAGGALATEAVSGLSGAIGEGMKDLGKEAATIKKNPIKKIAEFFGFSETSIVSDFKEALAEKKAGGFDGFFGGIKVWFYGFLAKMFGTDLTKHLTPEEMKLAGIKGKVAEGVKPETGSKPEIKPEKGDTIMTISYKGFARVFIQPVKDTTGKQKFFTYPEIDQIITVGPFREKKFNEIVKIYEKYKSSSDKNGIKNELGIADSNIDSDLLFFVIERICSGKGREYIDKHAIVGGDANITMGGIFTRLHKNMHIAEKFDTLKPSKPITGPSDVGEFLSEIGTKLDMPLDNPTALITNVDYQSSLKDLNIDASMLEYIISIRGRNINEISSTTIKESSINTPGGKESMNKVLDFWGKFQNTISDNFSFGNSSEYKKFFNDKGATLGDVFRLYVITGGNPDYGSMNHAQQAYVYMKLWGILGSDRDVRAKYFNQPLISALFDDTSKFTIPEGTKNIIKTLFENAAESTFEKIGGFISELWGTLSPKQKAILVTSIGAGLVLLWYLKPLRYIGIGVAATVIAGATGTAIAAMWPNIDKISVKGTEYTKEQLKDKMVEEIGKINN